MNKYEIHRGDMWVTVWADAFEVHESGRLELFKFDEQAEPVDVAVFSVWDFCVQVKDIP